jgi:hypothetical protein
MVAAWVFSVALTVAIVLITGNDGSSGGTTEAKTTAMKTIEEEFFGNPAHGELLPYQRFLREAQRARAQGDFKAERRYYKQVLDLLHTETEGGSSTAAGDHLVKGITGSHDHDQKLEQLIITVLGD